MLMAPTPDPLALLLQPAAPPVPVPAVAGAAVPPFAPTLAALLSSVTLPIAPDAARPPVAASGKTLPPTGEVLPVAGTDEAPAETLSPLAVESGSADEARLFAPVEPNATAEDPAAMAALAWLLPPQAAPASTKTAPAIPVAPRHDGGETAAAMTRSDDPETAGRTLAQASSPDASALPIAAPSPPGTAVIRPLDGAATATEAGSPTVARDRSGKPMALVPPGSIPAPVSMSAPPQPTAQTISSRSEPARAPTAPILPATARPGFAVPVAGAASSAPLAVQAALPPAAVPDGTVPKVSVPAAQPVVVAITAVEPRPLVPAATGVMILPPAGVAQAATAAAGAKPLAPQLDATAPGRSAIVPPRPIDMTGRPIAVPRPGIESAMFTLRAELIVAAPTDDRTGVSLATTPVAQQTQTITSVAAATSGLQPGIDLTRDPGLHRMIDRIETLRDGANANDTRIRLIPDALGPVEVSVKRDGETVQVRFTAQQEATRQLIAEAVPRLTELAEARGVRIDRTSVEGGNPQHGAQGWSDQSRQPAWAQPNQPIRPASAAAVQPDEDAVDPRSTIRIA